jgi:hypothetical protein
VVGNHGETFDLPEDIDPELWFECKHHPGRRDYLFDNHWHTFPGRMAAYCESRRLDFRVSLQEISESRGPATDWWIRGFLAGNLPSPPDVEHDDPRMTEWHSKAQAFAATGEWPAEPPSST